MSFRLAAWSTICFVIIVEGSHLRLSTHPTDSLASSNISVRQDESPGRQTEYKFVESAKGITKDGIQASFVTYQSTDGIVVFTRTEFFRRAAEVGTQFEARAASLSETIERSEVLINQAGIRKRILGRFTNEDEKRYIIISSNGLKISYIECVSLDHILDFEAKISKDHK